MLGSMETGEKETMPLELQMDHFHQVRSLESSNSVLKDETAIYIEWSLNKLEAYI